MSIFRVSRAVALGAALTLTILARAPAGIEARAQFQTTPTLFSGQATVISGTVIGVPIGPIVDTGPVAADGGTLEAHLICYPDGPNCTVGFPDLTSGALGVEVLNATVVAQGHRSSARASVADLTLNLDVLNQHISATFLQAQAAAQCAGDQASVQADSEIVGLVINGNTIAVSGQVNQRIGLPVAGGFVVINEQILSVNGNRHDVTVSALHIVIPAPAPGVGTTDLVIAQAHADIQCGVKFCPTDKDFVTGGGNFANPKRNFAVAGGIKNGGFWGHLLFIDHSPGGVKVKGTGVTVYGGVPGGSTTMRHIEGTYDSNSGAGNYSADVDDQGEPGVNDTLTLTLTPNGGMPVTVADGTIARGNIQLHTCK